MEMQKVRPKRVRLRRERGWRKPEGAVVVSRPTKWGNPWHVGPQSDRAAAVESYRRWLRGDLGDQYASERQRVLDSLSDLQGRDLACWCPLDEPCHADVLIEFANKRRK
jgi:hypothetical protein